MGDFMGEDGAGWDGGKGNEGAGRSDFSLDGPQRNAVKVASRYSKDPAPLALSLIPRISLPFRSVARTSRL